MTHTDIWGEVTEFIWFKIYQLSKNGNSIHTHKMTFLKIKMKAYTALPLTQHCLTWAYHGERPEEKTHEDSL